MYSSATHALPACKPSGVPLITPSKPLPQSFADTLSIRGLQSKAIKATQTAVAHTTAARTSMQTVPVQQAAVGPAMRQSQQAKLPQ